MRCFRENKKLQFGQAVCLAIFFTLKIWQKNDKKFQILSKFVRDL